MIKYIRSAAIAAILPLALVACGQASTPSDNAAKTAQAAAAVTSETRLVAATVYADWCGSCKTLDPKVEAAKASLDDAGVSFVKLDYTAKDKDAFYAMAKAAGVEEAVRGELGDTIKTGQLFLIDLDDKIIVKVIRKDAEPDAIAADIAAAAAAA